MIIRTTLAALTLLAGVTAVSAVEAALTLTLNTDNADFERSTVLYDCSDGEPFDVTYINAAPNFLALVPIAGEPELHVFAAVISASGVRYASGQWVWWTKGSEASLYDTMLGEDADPVLTCSEMVNTP